MLSVRQDVTLGLCIFHQIITHDLLLIQYLHGVVFAGVYLCAIGFEGNFFDQKDLAERALAELHHGNEVAWAHKLVLLSCLLLLSHLLEHLIVLPDLDKLLLPLLVLISLFFFLFHCLFTFFGFLLLSASRLPLLLLQPLN